MKKIRGKSKPKKINQSHPRRPPKADVRALTLDLIALDQRVTALEQQRKQAEPDADPTSGVDSAA